MPKQNEIPVAIAASSIAASTLAASTGIAASKAAAANGRILKDRADEVSGQRRLVRPRLADKPAGLSTTSRRKDTSLLAHQEGALAHTTYSGSHAEVLYLQKQIQTQTVMVFVLDNGERIKGVIEWYDLHVIKVRHSTRTMIYKSSIKYLYKAEDARTNGV